MKFMMRTLHIQDTYNPKKMWIIRHTKCGHYYLSQTVCGQITGKKTRFTKKELRKMFPDWI